MTNDERKEILQRVAAGELTIDEALELFEKSSQNNATPPVMPLNDKQEPFAEDLFTKEEPKKQTTGFEDIFGKAFQKDANKGLDDMLNDLRGDLSQFGNRMMTLFNSTFSKVREFDVEFPFGEKLEFDRAFAYPAAEVKGFDLSIPNGKLVVTQSEEPIVTANVRVKLMKSNGESEELVERFAEELVRFVEGKLTIATDSKLAHIAVELSIPAKQYDVLFAKMLSGSIELTNVDAKIVKLKTYNGAIRAHALSFDHAHFNAGNGSIEVRGAEGADLEAETVNGRIYVDGKIDEVEAQSVNGHVVVTTSSDKPHKLKAHTVAGAVELYVPKHVSLDGKVSSNFGKTDVGLPDVHITNEDEQLLLKTVHFNKLLDDAPLLKLSAESRTGTVLIRYTVTK